VNLLLHLFKRAKKDPQNQGIGAGFVPDVLKMELVKRDNQGTDEDAFEPHAI
jgi:hypothetical protein